jgi:hypothetical protein
MFLEFTNSQEVFIIVASRYLCSPFKEKKSWHLPMEYILTSTLYYENGVEILVDTDFGTLILAKVR